MPPKELQSNIYSLINQSMKAMSTTFFQNPILKKLYLRIRSIFYSNLILYVFMHCSYFIKFKYLIQICIVDEGNN